MLSPWAVACWTVVGTLILLIIFLCQFGEICFTYYESKWKIRKGQRSISAAEQAYLAGRTGNGTAEQSSVLHPEGNLAKCILVEQTNGEGQELDPVGQVSNATDQVYEIMQQCWNPDPEDRPSFTALEITLKEQYDTISETIKQKKNVVSDDVSVSMDECQNSAEI